MVDPVPHAHLEALRSSLATITVAKPDTDMTPVLPVIDAVFSMANANRYGATKAYQLLSIVDQLLADNVTIKIMDDANEIASYTLPMDMVEAGKTVALNINGYVK